MREYKAIVGATEGNIIAAIITTQTSRNQLRLPRLVQGPASMPRICLAIHHQPTTAIARSSATKPSRTLAATNVARTSTPSATRVVIATAVTSCRPGELRCRKPRLALVIDPERVDTRAACLAHLQV